MNDNELIQALNQFYHQKLRDCANLADFLRSGDWERFFHLAMDKVANIQVLCERAKKMNGSEVNLLVFLTAIILKDEDDKIHATMRSVLGD
jgi:hypothetical protein